MNATLRCVVRNFNEEKQHGRSQKQSSTKGQKQQSHRTRSNHIPGAVADSDKIAKFMNNHKISMSRDAMDRVAMQQIGRVSGGTSGTPYGRYQSGSTPTRKRSSSK